MTAPDLVEVVVAVLDAHFIDREQSIDDQTGHSHTFAMCVCNATYTHPHIARAVLAALTEAGNVEWGVENGHEPIDHVTEADNQDAAIAEAEDRKAIGIPSRAVYRFTGTWTAVK